MCRRSLRRFLVHMTVVSFTCVTDLFYTWHTALYICDTGLFLHVLQVFTWVSFTCDIGLFYMRYTSLLHMPYSCLAYDIGLFLKVPQISMCVSFTYDIGLLSARPNQLFMFPYWCVYFTKAKKSCMSCVKEIHVTSKRDHCLFYTWHTALFVFHKSFLLIAQYTFKILFQGFCTPGSDPPHKIMRY